MYVAVAQAGFLVATRDLGEVDKLAADDRNNLLQTNKDVILAHLAFEKYLGAYSAKSNPAWKPCPHKLSEDFDGLLGAPESLEFGPAAVLHPSEVWGFVREPFSAQPSRLTQIPRCLLNLLCQQ